MSSSERKIQLSRVKDIFPKEILEHLSCLTEHHSEGIYLAGGTVRDLLIGRKPADLDLTVSFNARQWAYELSNCCGGALVALGREEDAARVVWKNINFDFTSFRDGTTTIEQDLSLRDFTVNSLGICIDKMLTSDRSHKDQLLPVIDPCHGLKDLAAGVIRFSSSRSPLDDPLRLLRAFRFGAILGFDVIPETMKIIRRHRDLIGRVSPERIACELDHIMASTRAYQGFALMKESKILFTIFPELLSGVGMEQPASHHLDVFDHLLVTLTEMEKIQANPGKYFPKHQGLMFSSLHKRQKRLYLKWAALLHDLGKPVTYNIKTDKVDKYPVSSRQNIAGDGQITFYNHDIRGAELVAVIGERLRWSRQHVQSVSLLVRNHMRPFFLANDLRKDKLTLKGCLRLIKTVDEELSALFMLAMADALAGKGDNRPDKIEQEIAELFTRLYQVWQERVMPIRNVPPLITGNDLITELDLQPGPLFRELLELIEEAHLEGKITSRAQALDLASELVKGC